MRMPSTAPRGSAVPVGLPRPGAARRPPLAARARQVPALAGRHWLLTVLLTAGVTLRVLSQIAYRPALLYIDSTKYLLGAYPGDDPPGYRFAIKPVLALGNLGLVATLQHLLGLAMAIGLYALLQRRGVPRWLSALATAPLLLDGYQLQIEQNIMPDVMFEAFAVAGLAALLWFPRPRPWLTAVGGLALGASATARQVGEILILPAVLFLAIAVPGWGQRLKQAAACAAAFALPILFASYANYLSIHRFSLAPYASGTIYGRMAAAADCATLKLPSYERSLCPTSWQQAQGPDWLDHHTGSPIKFFQAPPGRHTSAVVRDFVHRVLFQQPLSVAAGVGHDAVTLFALSRAPSPGDAPVSRWQFQRSYPLYPPYVAVQNHVFVFGTFTPDGTERLLGTGQRFGGGGPAVNRPLAAFLRAYQLGGGYTPGPFFAFAVLAGLAGSLALLRRRLSPPRRAAALACLLFFTSGAAVLLTSDLFEFSWRYQLPALITLPPAAALAVTVFLGHFSRRRRPAVAPGARPVATTEPGPPGQQVPTAEPGPPRQQVPTAEPGPPGQQVPTAP
jgi:Dolichyl-phosphate-mannose-protein mannosyltransferase